MIESRNMWSDGTPSTKKSKGNDRQIQSASEAPSWSK